MFLIDNLIKNQNLKTIDKQDPFIVVEWIKDTGTKRETSEEQFYSSKMNVHAKQIICDLNKSDTLFRNNAVLWMVGNIEETGAGIKSAAEVFTKLKSGKSSSQSQTISEKPEYSGKGYLMSIPTNNHLHIIDVENDWQGGVTIDDNTFVACTSSLHQKINSKSSTSPTLVGGTGRPTITFHGVGKLVVEVEYPFDDLIEIKLENDILKVNCGISVAWSSTLQHTVENQTDIFKGNGKVLLYPLPINKPPL